MPVVSSEPQLFPSVWPTATDHVTCVHCGEPCGSRRVTTDAGPFCCGGCASVYALLRARGLDAFYSCEIPAGLSQRDAGLRDPSRFLVLDDPAVRERFVRRDDGRQAHVTFPVPSLHCASCVWLLERLGRVDDRIGRTEVDLLRRTVTVVFDSARMPLSEVAAVLAGVGYEPMLTDEAPKPATAARRRLYARIGVAGFAFGNIMLFSIPRYANGAPLEDGFQRLFDALNVALAIPVLLYSAADFFKGAWQAVRHRTISLDVPIVIGLLALVLRSLFDIGTGRGEGYLDSFAGLVFFLLVGRLFHQQAFDWIGFDRTFRSFFPLSVLVESGAGRAVPVAIDRLRPGDLIVLRPEEVVPVDARLVDDHARVDYAFLTGERDAVAVASGALVRAGGRLTGTSARFEVLREVTSSDLAGLWTRRGAAAPRSHWLTDVSGRFGAWFVILALGLAMAGYAWWWPDTTRGLEIATAVLIIACPCALTLAAPITLGTAMTMLGRRGWYLKDPAALLDLSRVDSVVFDKTGTLTASGQMTVTVSGLTDEDEARVRALAAGSVHPISRALAGSVRASLPVDARAEVIGRGLRGIVDGHAVALGSPAFIRDDCGATGVLPASGTVVAIDGVIGGCISAHAPVRPGIEAAIRTLAASMRVSLLSGDRDAGDERWARLFGDRATFNQAASQKREHVASLRAAGEHVLMIGDGLNDAGAFEAADIGVAVSDDTACLVPACDVVVAGAQLATLPQVIVYARRARRTIIICFVISLFYNAIGLSLALAGLLSPLVAAILMPVSSLTVVGTSVGLARWWAGRVPAP